MQFTKEQLALKFAAQVLESVTSMATSIRCLFETGKDLQGIKHVLAPEELREGFSPEQLVEIDNFVATFANPLSNPAAPAPTNLRMLRKKKE